MDISKNEILEANIREHAKEAEYYDLIHTEIFNSYEQKRINNELLNILKNFDKSVQILEIGAGTGNLTEKLIDEGFENIVCVDISKEMLQILNKKIKSKRVTTVVSDIDSFILKNKTRFDIVLISSVLHHLPNYEKTVKKMRSILNKNGMIYITHEPYKLKSNQDILAKTIVQVDYFMYILRYLLLISTGKLKYLQRDCSVSDYHTGDKAIQISKIKQLFDKKSYTVKVNYYSVAKNSLTAFLLNRLKKYNNFEIIVYKK